MPTGIMSRYMTPEQLTVYTDLSRLIIKQAATSPLLVAISGKDGSGKTMMANILAKFLAGKSDREIIRISIDDFMNPRAIRYTPTESAGRSCYEYTFNFDGFITNVLEPLQAGGSYEYRAKIFDHATDSEMFAPRQTSSADAIVIIDGVFLFKDSLIDYWDIKILLETSDDVVIERGARRDTERLGSYKIAKQKYIDRYIASQTIYYNEESPREKADIIINNNDIESPSIIRMFMSSDQTT